MAQIAVFGSGAGSNFRALWEEFGSEIVLVASDCCDAGILMEAEKRGVKSVYEEGANFCEGILAYLEGVDLICLAGFMRLVKDPLLSAFEGKILNIHPSVLPSFPGLRAWEQAIEAGVRCSGCTVHYVDAGMDTGEVILQAEVPVLKGDTPEALHARIQIEERRIYPLAVREILHKKRAVK